MDIKQEGGENKQVGKAIKNKYFIAQAGTPQAIRALGMARSLPIAWWLPKLGGEDAPSGPLPKAMPKSPHPVKIIILQDLFFQPGCAWWEVLLFLLLQTVLVMRGSCSVPSLVGVCHLQGKLGMGIQEVAGEGKLPPTLSHGSVGSPKFALNVISQVNPSNPCSFPPSFYFHGK